MKLPTYLTLTLATAALAAGPAIDWWTVDGGGGTSSGGAFEVSGTIGQPDAGPVMSGGAFQITGGFWPAWEAVQLNGGPPLSIRASGANVILSWPLAATGWTLDRSPTLTPAASWTATTQPIVDTATEHTVTVPRTGATRMYFRLKK